MKREEKKRKNADEIKNKYRCITANWLTKREREREVTCLAAAVVLLVNRNLELLVLY